VAEWLHTACADKPTALEPYAYGCAAVHVMGSWGSGCLLAAGAALRGCRGVQQGVTPVNVGLTQRNLLNLELSGSTWTWRLPPECAVCKCCLACALPPACRPRSHALHPTPAPLHPLSRLRRSPHPLAATPLRRPQLSCYCFPL
jgi:hypothetical protein